MSQTVDQSFVREYETNVHLEYQRMGSKLRNTVRTATGIVGESTTFQKIGSGTAGQKTRHGNVPVMNLDHTPATCTLGDWYAADNIDKLDLNKLRHDERQAIARSGGAALGRKTDEIIIDALDTTSNATPNTVLADGTTGSATGMNRGKALHAMTALGTRDVPVDDGRSIAVVGWKQWSELMTIEEFSSADYVSQDALPWKGGMTAKMWLGAMWFPHSGLSIDGSSDRSCHWYHWSAVGHAIGQDVTSMIDWVPTMAGWLANNFMSMGGCLIDTSGVQEIVCRE